MTPAEKVEALLALSRSTTSKDEQASARDAALVILKRYGLVLTRDGRAVPREPPPVPAPPPAPPTPTRTPRAPRRPAGPRAPRATKPRPVEAPAAAFTFVIGDAVDWDEFVVRAKRFVTRLVVGDPSAPPAPPERRPAPPAPPKPRSKPWDLRDVAQSVVSATRRTRPRRAKRNA